MRRDYYYYYFKSQRLIKERKHVEGKKKNYCLMKETKYKNQWLKKKATVWEMKENTLRKKENKKKKNISYNTHTIHNGGRGTFGIFSSTPRHPIFSSKITLIWRDFFLIGLERKCINSTKISHIFHAYQTTPKIIFFIPPISFQSSGSLLVNIK